MPLKLFNQSIRLTEITVLFCDLRDFTTMTDAMEPQVIVRLLDAGRLGRGGTNRHRVARYRDGVAEHVSLTNLRPDKLLHLTCTLGVEGRL